MGINRNKRTNPPCAAPLSPLFPWEKTRHHAKRRYARWICSLDSVYAAQKNLKKKSKNVNTIPWLILVLQYFEASKALPNGISKTADSCNRKKLEDGLCKCNIEEAFICHPNFLQYPIFYILIGGELDEIGSILNILRNGNGVTVITGTETSISTPRNLAEYLAKVKNVVQSNRSEDSYDNILIKNCAFIRKNLGYERTVSTLDTYKSCYTQGWFSEITF